MYPDFLELNLYVYHSVVNIFLDLVIWCLGPYVDTSRRYGPARRLLALLTRTICCLWLSLTGTRRNPV